MEGLGRSLIKGNLGGGGGSIEGGTSLTHEFTGRSSILGKSGSWTP